MSDFLYYVPNSKVAKAGKPTAMELRDLSLDHACDESTTCRAVTSGPDNMGGFIMSVHDEAARFKYDPKAQTWAQMGEAWIGYWNDAPRPTPDDVARDKQLTGEWLKFENGTNWLIPNARRFVDDDGELYAACNLPQRFTLVDGDWVQGGVKARYQALWDLVIGYETAMAEGTVEGGTVHFMFDGINELAVAGMAVNYRIGKHELDALGIFDQEVRDSIIDILRDQKTWLEWAKKKDAEPAPAGGDSSNGPEPSTADKLFPTGQPLQTCSDGSLVGIDKVGA